MCSRNTICEDTVALKFWKCSCFSKYSGIKQLCTTEGRERVWTHVFLEVVFGYQLSCFSLRGYQLLSWPVCCVRCFCFSE